MRLYASAVGGGAAVAKVPLLETSSGGVVVESIDIVRHLARGTELCPPGESGSLDAFVDLWTGTVERAYYDVLRASSEAQARFALTGLISALSQLEERLWECKMQQR